MARTTIDAMASATVTPNSKTRNPTPNQSILHRHLRSAARGESTDRVSLRPRRRRTIALARSSNANCQQRIAR